MQHYRAAQHRLAVAGQWIATTERPQYVRLGSYFHSLCVCVTESLFRLLSTHLERSQKLRAIVEYNQLHARGLFNVHPFRAALRWQCVAKRGETNFNSALAGRRE